METQVFETPVVPNETLQSYDLERAPVVYVGLVGRHGIGKSSLVTALYHHFRENAYLEPVVEQPYLIVPIRVSFADELRESLGQATYTLPTKVKKHPLERQALQWVGEVSRARDRNIWLQSYLRQVDIQINYPSEPILEQPGLQPVVVVLTDDVYHVNEAAAMDLLVYIHSRPETPSIVGVYRSVAERETELLLDNDLVSPEEDIHIIADIPAELVTENNVALIADLVHSLIYYRLDGVAMDSYADD